MNESSGIILVADRYAEAMMQIAEKQDNFDLINSDLQLIKETLNSSRDLKEFIEHPLISSEDKKEILTAIFNNSIQNSTLKLVKILADSKRLIILYYLADHYKKMLFDKRNITTAKVITAVEVSEEILDRVRDKLERLFNKNIQIESNIDKEIIAGMIINIDDKVIDGSIRTKLLNMKKQLI
jgi:F-type H+-transporting ATPase subunit delta